MLTSIIRDLIILAAIAIAAGLIAAWHANPYPPGPVDAVEAAK